MDGSTKFLIDAADGAVAPPVAGFGMWKDMRLPLSQLSIIVDNPGRPVY